MGNRNTNPAEEREIEKLQKRIAQLEGCISGTVTSHESLYSIIDRLPLLVCRLKPDGTIIFVNEAYCIYFGIPFKKLVGSNLLDLLPEHLREETRLRFKSIKPGSAPISTEHKTFRADGAERWQRWTDYAIENEAGEIELVCTGEDITAQKSMEEALHESLNMYKTLVDISPDAIIVTDTKGAIIFTNRQTLDIFGYASADEIRGTSCAEYIEENEVDRFLKNIALTTKIGSFTNIEFTCKKKNGENFPAEISMSLIKNDLGQDVGLYGIIRDSSVKKFALEALLETERRLTQIINFLPDPTFGIDTDGKVIFWNRAIQNMTGLEAKDIIGKTYRDYSEKIYNSVRPFLADYIITRDEDSCRKSYKDLIQDGDTLLAESFARKVGDGGAFLWIKAGPLFDAAGQLIGAIESFRDITDKTNMEINLRALTQRVFSTQEQERGRLAHELHDSLGMALAAFRMDLDWLRKKTVDPALKERLGDISDSALQAAGELSRICKGLRPLVLDSFGLSHAMRELAGEFAGKNVFSIKCDIDEIEPDAVSRESAVNLYRILQEALANVAKHSRADSVSISFSLENDCCILRISDNGRGFNADASSGRGLGMLGMKERAAYCGGSLEITTAPGKGATLEARFPAAKRNNRKHSDD